MRHLCLLALLAAGIAAHAEVVRDDITLDKTATVIAFANSAVALTLDATTGALIQVRDIPSKRLVLSASADAPAADLSHDGAWLCRDKHQSGRGG